MPESPDAGGLGPTTSTQLWSRGRGRKDGTPDSFPERGRVSPSLLVSRAILLIVDGLAKRYRKLTRATEPCRLRTAHPSRV